MSTSLFHTLQASYWKQPLWQGFQSEVESLVKSIADYTEYLVAQNKTTKTLHAHETPVRQISRFSLCQVCPCVLLPLASTIHQTQQSSDG